MAKLAFYIMGQKGYVTLKRFIKKHGAEAVTFVVSSGDKHVKKDYFKEICELAITNNIKVFNRTDNFLDSANTLELYKFAIGWRWLIKNEQKLIIFHDSLLPKYRGFAPLVNSLINNEPNVGVTAIEASCDYDQGNIIAQEKLEIEYPIKINEVIDKILPLYFCLVDDLYRKINLKGALEAKVQNENDATYSLWLNSDDYYVDWSWSASKIKSFVDAVGYPYDGAKAKLDTKIIYFLDVEVDDDIAIENRERHIGKVIFKKNKLPVVVCKTGLLRLVDIRDYERNSIEIKFRSRFY